MVSRGKSVIHVFQRYLSTCILSRKKMNADIAVMRIDYKLGVQLDADCLPVKNPMSLFEMWFTEAKDCEKIEEPNAMTLATSTRTGIPSARIVLLKGFDKRGFRFYTNYQSRKGKELEENPNAALIFFWPPLQKQIRIEGKVIKLSVEESVKYFHSRPVGSQIGACVSHQSVPIPSRQVLIDKETELKEKFAKREEIPKPDFWGGYLVDPKIFEFWQGQSNRLHDRIQFKRAGYEQSRDESLDASNCWKNGEDGWIYSRLSP